MSFIFLDIVMNSSLLATLSVAEPPESLFQTPSNQGKKNQPRIAAGSVYFALYDSICYKDKSICRWHHFLSAIAVDYSCSIAYFTSLKSPTLVYISKCGNH